MALWVQKCGPPHPQQYVDTEGHHHTVLHMMNLLPPSTRGIHQFVSGLELYRKYYWIHVQFGWGYYYIRGIKKIVKYY